MHRSDQRILDGFVRIAFRGHHKKIPPDQLDPFMLREHAGLDHAAKLVDREWSTRRQVLDRTGNCDIHVNDPISVPI
jgi:hypothetical protein